MPSSSISWCFIRLMTFVASIMNMILAFATHVTANAPRRVVDDINPSLRTPDYVLLSKHLYYESEHSIIAIFERHKAFISCDAGR